MKAIVYRYVVRLHRWLALAFALPLLVVIVTGLILSFEPIAQQVPAQQPVTLPAIEGYLAQHDPDGRARSLGIRTYDNTLTIGGVGSRGSVVVDLGSGRDVTPAPGGWFDIFLVSRRMHETLLLDLGGLVTVSTMAMLLIVVLGTVLGWPRLKHSLRGWHQGIAWITLPLLIASPLTALAMVYGLTLSAPAGGAGAGGGRVSMAEAVRLIAADHDLAKLTSIRQRGGRLMARIFVDGELRGFAVTPGALRPLERNWPRLVHEGNWGGDLGSILNVLTSVAALALLGTGLLLWLRRTRRRPGQARTPLRAASAVRLDTPRP
ncbi:MAG: PepSY domain-containing protein [Hyphomicrobiales bacterium]|nr:PepSY domain-containing protein [Hyphomicrobiales bacterium]